MFANVQWDRLKILADGFRLADDPRLAFRFPKHTSERTGPVQCHADRRIDDSAPQVGKLGMGGRDRTRKHRSGIEMPHRRRPDDRARSGQEVSPRPVLFLIHRLSRN